MRSQVAVPVRSPRRWVEALLVLACVGFALWMQRRSLACFFAPDDLILLERAGGLLPPQPTLWRLLSNRAYAEIMFHLFGANPVGSHLVAWLLHGANVALLFAWTRRAGGGRLAATVAATLFGVSRSHFTALGQLATSGDLLSTGFLLGALLLVGRRQWFGLPLAAVLFAAAVLAKETVALMPLVLLLPGPLPGTLRARLRRSAPLVGLGLAWWVYLLAGSPRTQALTGSAYATHFGVNLFHNLMTYADWAIDLRTTLPDYFGTYSTTAWTAGIWVWAGLAAVAWLARRRSPLPAIGAAWWGLGLLPVLPLLYHSYLHYLYLPLVGLAMALGGTFEWLALLLRGPGRRHSGGRAHERAMALEPPVWAWLPAIVLLLAYAGASDRLVVERFRERLPSFDLPIDPYLRKMEWARRTADAVAGTVRAGGRRIAFLVPDGPERAYQDLIRETLDQGRGLRFLEPGLDSVAYLTDWSPAQRDFELFVQDANGHAQHLGTGADALLGWSLKLELAGHVSQARAALDSALRVWPDDARLAAARARLLVAR